jgi:hypothetical protein
MEQINPAQPSAMRVVWPQREQPQPQFSGFDVRPVSADELAAFGADEQYVPCKWEERFDICEMQAILHMLHHLTQGLPSPLRRWLLRRAGRLPKLHGHFGPFCGGLGFHAEEGEVIGMGETWRVMEKGVRERLW